MPDNIKKATRYSNTGIANSQYQHSYFTPFEADLLFKLALIAAFFYVLAVIVTVFIIGQFLSGWWAL